MVGFLLTSFTIIADLVVLLIRSERLTEELEYWFMDDNRHW